MPFIFVLKTGLEGFNFLFYIRVLGGKINF